MNKRYRLGEIEEAVSEMEELIDIEDDIAVNIVSPFSSASSVDFQFSCIIPQQKRQSK